MVFIYFLFMPLIMYEKVNNGKGESPHGQKT